MGRQKGPFKKHSSQVNVSGGSSGGLDDAVQRVIADQGTEHDWRNSITVPRPRMWEERPDLIGKTVIPHTCEAREHGDNEGCICDLIGEPVVITKIDDSPFVVTPSYHIKGSKKRIQEREFSAETRGKDPDTVEGFILEGPDGKFLTAGFVWMPAKKPLDGYLHNSQVVRDLLAAKFSNGRRPTKAYPASSKLGGDQKRITGDAVAFDQLTL
ncbi:MAG: hypothetical protein A2843_02550 [Candidatus Wildermuthbacteria bacterium RIFCSPHIGHO2_01_FULL_48_27b]|uniref:Uncharacterized protein n=1 Tax=Candidatus Wildermuthbacteria bacterium RIFCSPHIGHO2_01_FULL_48_27b TaxID=1802447 RepID=A0A1G2QUQ1_9BACT|nr:MAG: hypothetical protein A2843_02550 [Candidatus Wildermuthbacteria bacterium RIFCSPHIGHO2_01_FULL_48_27b]